MSLLCLILLGLLSPSFSQTSTSLSVTFPSLPCPNGLFFDTSALKCLECANGTFVSDTGLTCFQCDGTSGSLFDFEAGNTLLQRWTPAYKSDTSNTCICPAAEQSSSVVSTVFSFGSMLQRCISCEPGSIPDTGAQTCMLSGGSGTAEVTTPTQDLQYALTQLAVGGGVSRAQTAVFPSASVANSRPLVEVLGPAARGCLDGDDRESCNAVANLCALQLYNTDQAACQLYESLVVRKAGSSGTPSRPSSNPRPPTGPLPWLFYSGVQYSESTDIDLRMQFKGGSIAEGRVSQLTFMLATYALNGTYLGMTHWQKQFQICGADKWESGQWQRFGWLFENKCEIWQEDIIMELPTSREPVFYDPFLQTGPNTYYPVPVKVMNLDDANGYTENEGAVRRFFYVDGALGTDMASNFRVMQYPTEMRLIVRLRDSPRDRIFPPTLFIRYASRQVGSVGSTNNVAEKAEFTVTYENSGNLNDKFWYAWQTMLIVFEVVIAFPLFMWKMYRFLKKRKGEQADQDLIVYTVICVCDVGSLALCMVLGLVSLYYLIIIKLQESVYFLMVRDGDLHNFRVTVILAIVGQTVGLLHTLYQQTNVDVFFLDWEKPRRVLSRDGHREEDAPISSWRMLTVANEFNKLQTKRLTSPAFTLIMFVFILVGQNLEAAGEVTPDAEDYEHYQYTVTSIILRWGIQVAFFLVLYLGQYLVVKLLYYPYVSNPLTNFIDLMYLANISTIVLDDKHSGYYLHGRNHSQHSDTTLRVLNDELEKEGEGLVANRGFITTYQDNKKLNDNQLFLIYLTDAVRKQYEQKMLRQAEQAAIDARMRKGQVVSFVKGTGKPNDAMLRAKDDVSDLFRGVIEDVERNHATMVIDPTYTQMLTQVLPEAAANNNVFVHDHFHTFTTTTFLGIELRLYIYEALFFLAVDMDLRNIPLTALLTFIVVQALSWLRATMGKNNISRKTIVDNHFLL